MATGARAAIPNIKGLKDISYLSNENIFLQESIPESMIIIGTGAIGIEKATAFNRLGTKITLLSRSTGILKSSDDELSSISVSYTNRTLQTNKEVIMWDGSIPLERKKK